MTFTIMPGWWLLPLAFSVALFVWAASIARRNGQPDRYGAGAILIGVLYLLAAFGSTIAWLIWSLLR